MIFVLLFPPTLRGLYPVLWSLCISLPLVRQQGVGLLQTKKYHGLKTLPTRISAAHFSQTELFIRPRKGIICLIVKFPGLLSTFFNLKKNNNPILLMFLSFSWHLFALAPVPCPPHSKQQWDHRGDCVLNVSRISWPRHAVEKGWTEDGEVPLQGKQTNKISHQESWLFPGHFPTGNRTSLGSQGNCVSAHTHTPAQQPQGLQCPDVCSTLRNGSENRNPLSIYQQNSSYLQ